MALRKASAYTKKRQRTFTRTSKVKSKNYIKTKPPQQIVRFKMGKKSEYNEGKLKNIIKLVSKEKVLIRDNSLEAARKCILRLLQKEIPDKFYLEVKPYPHIVLRENKVYSGASKGERVNTGMAQSYGGVIGRAASVKKEQVIILIAHLNKQDRKFIVDSIEKIKPKLPCKTKLEMEKLD